MIFGDTSEHNSKAFAPNFNTGRVVKLKGRYNETSPDIVIEDVAFTPKELRDTSNYLLDIIKSKVKPKKKKSTQTVAVDKKPKKVKTEFLSNTEIEATTATKPKPKKKKVLKVETEVSPAPKPKPKKKKVLKVETESHSPKLKPKKKKVLKVETEVSPAPKPKPKKKKVLKVETEATTAPKVMNTKEQTFEEKVTSLAKKPLLDLNSLDKKTRNAVEDFRLREKVRQKLIAAALESNEECKFDVDAAFKKFENAETEEPVAKKVVKKKKKKPANFQKVLESEKAVLIDEEVDLPKEPRIVADRKIGKQYAKIVPQNVPGFDARRLASNAVDIPIEEVEDFRKTTLDLTRKYVDFLRNDILPHFIALDSAIEYSMALMMDGLGRDDIKTDDTLLTSLKWVLHKRALNYFGELAKVDVNSSEIEQVLAEMYKTDLSKRTAYSTDTVGVVQEKTLGTVKSRGAKDEKAYNT